MKRRFLIVFTMIFALVLGLGVLSACGGGNNGEMTITQTELTLAIGQSRLISATITDKSDTSEISWSSSNESVVTVKERDKRGRADIEAVGSGKATITAESASGKKASCEVTVEDIVVEISGEGVADGKLTMERYATLKLTGTVKKDGQTLSGETLTWSSTDPDIVSVTNDGTLTAVKEGTATVSATRTGGAKAEISVTVVWSERPNNWYALHDWEQNKITPNLWGYWVDANHEPQFQTNIKVINAEYLGDPTGTGLVAGGVTMTYENQLDGANEHGIQLFYRSSKGYTQYDPQYDASKLLLEVGKNYVLKMDITVTASGTITVNGTQYEVVANQKQSIVAPFLHDDDGRIHDKLPNGDPDYNNVNSAVFLMMGANGTMIQAATVRLENIRWEAWDGGTASLETPTFTLSGKNVTITDPNTAGVKSYTIGLFEKEAAVDADPVRSFTFTEKTAPIDDAKWPNGDYELRIRANGTDKRYGDSAWSQGQNYKVDHGPVTYNLKEGNAAAAKADLTDTYYYSLQDGATVETATYNDGNITFKYAGNVNWYSVQIFYKNPALTAGAQYSLTFTLNSPLAGKIRINAKMFDLVVGDNAIEVEYIEGMGADGLSMNIQFGEPDVEHNDYNTTLSVLAEGTFTFKNIAWEKHETKIARGEQKNAVDNPGTWYLWADQNWTESNVTVIKEELDMDAKTLTLGYTTTGNPNLGYSVQLFFENGDNTTGTAYTLTMKVKLSVAGTITINDKQYTFTAGQEQNLSIEYTEKGNGGQYNEGASIIVLMGVYQQTPVMNAEITISGWAWTAGASTGGGSIPSTPVSGTLPNGGQGDAVNNPGTFYLWWDQGWNESTVTMGEHTVDYDAKTIHFTYTASGNNKQGAGVQLFYENPGAVDGKEYTVTLTIQISVDCTIRVCGKVEEFKAGVARTLTIKQSEPGNSGLYNEGSTISIQMGVETPLSNVLSADVTISNWSVTG